MPTPASAEGRRYRGAVLGAGGIARQAHLPALREAPAVSARVEVVAVVDPAPDVPPVDGLPLLPDRAALARVAPLDFIDICTPTASHLELTLWGLAQGYHVVCEKPVALTRAEAEQIAQAARARGRIVMPCHQHRYNPVWVTVKEWLRAGAIGRWHLAELAVYRPRADPGRAAGGTPWRGTRDAARGGVLLDHGTHLLYHLLDLAGMPRAVSAWTGRLRHRDYEVEDTAVLHLEYPGRLATVFCSWAARVRETRLRFVGDAGTIEWADGELRLERDGTVERRDGAAALDKAAYRGWFACLFEAFVAALDAGDPARAGAGYLEDIGRVAAVLEHAYRAARTGRTVAVADGA
jgi:predicted dehydrogenase